MRKYPALLPSVVAGIVLAFVSFIGDESGFWIAVVYFFSEVILVNALFYMVVDLISMHSNQEQELEQRKR